MAKKKSALTGRAKEFRDPNMPAEWRRMEAKARVVLAFVASKEGIIGHGEAIDRFRAKREENYKKALIDLGHVIFGEMLTQEYT